jgi:hypothetical protein
LPERRHQTIVANDPLSAERLMATPEPAEQEDTEEKEAAAAGTGQENAATPFNFVTNLQNFIPKLGAAEEKQIQEAIVESKKVIEEIQWKELEKGIGDALTRNEKDRMKESFEMAMKNIDWETLGDKFRIAYNNIDWPTINMQLDNALAAIKMDSLQQVYTIAIDNVSKLQKELVKENQVGIPDTDINLKSLDMKKNELQKVIDKLRKMKKSKEVIHL